MNVAPPEDQEPLVQRCREGAAVLVDRCARVAAGEKCYVLADHDTFELARFVADACARSSGVVRFEVAEPLRMHGAAPAEHVGISMAWADVIFCLTRMSLAHTAERQAANARGARFLSLPDYSIDVLAGPSLRYDFALAIPTAQRLKDVLDGASEIRVTSALGTELTMQVVGRIANACPGTCWEPGTLGSPPDAEVNIAPLEGTAEGVVHVDGSIPCREIGRLEAPIVLDIRGGAITGIRGRASEVELLEHVFSACSQPQLRWLAEFGIGLNPSAQLVGRMLEDEGCAGTIHLGFGSNATIGGLTRVPFHLDFVVCSPSVLVDGESLMNAGVLVVPPSRLAA